MIAIAFSFSSCSTAKRVVFLLSKAFMRASCAFLRSVISFSFSTAFFSGGVTVLSLTAFVDA